MIKNKISEKFYEETDFSDLLKSSAKKRVTGKQNKRITMNISEDIFDEAHVLDKFMTMGYQNVLKTAMTLGIHQLQNTITKQISITKSLKKMA